MPRLHEGRGEVEAIVKAANRLTAVPDPWITVSIAPEAPPEAVELLLNGLRASAYQFADLRAMACSVTAEALWIRSVPEPSPLGELMPAGWHATIEGPDAGTRRRFERPDGDRRSEALVQPRSILVAYPPGGRPRTIFSWEGDPGELTARLVQGIARVVAVFAVAASLALLLIYFLQVALHRRA
jgi:hypothetical protein